MSGKRFKTVRYVVIAMTMSAWGIRWDSASAAPQHSGHANHQQSGSAEPQPGSVPDEHGGYDQPAVAPHGGQLTTLKPLSFEVVYQPKEIRVYLYGPIPQPANSKSVKGEISLQQRGGKRVTRLTLQHVAPPEGESSESEQVTSYWLPGLKEKSGHVEPCCTDADLHIDDSADGNVWLYQRQVQSLDTRSIAFVKDE